MAATSGYFLATRRVAPRHEPEAFKDSSRGVGKGTPEAPHGNIICFCFSLGEGIGPLIPSRQSLLA